MGERKLKYKETMAVVDRKHDIMSSINMEPDERGLLTKMFLKRTTYPDFFKYIPIND
jgi:hypothetical protein